MRWKCCDETHLLKFEKCDPWRVCAVGSCLVFYLEENIGSLLNGVSDTESY